MKQNAFMLILFAMLFSCSSEQGTLNKTHIFNSDVATSLKNFNKEFNAARTELQFTSGVKVNSCNAYAKEIVSSEISEDVNNQLVRSEYLLCDSLILLRDRPFSIVAANVETSNLLANRLDLRSFPSSLGPRLDEKNHTFKSIAGNNLFIKTNDVVYETEDWHYRVELIAISDVNNNEKDDWILWFTDESKAGNYRSYQTLVLYDVDASKQSLVAQSYIVN